MSLFLSSHVILSMPMPIFSYTSMQLSYTTSFLRQVINHEALYVAGQCYMQIPNYATIGAVAIAVVCHRLLWHKPKGLWQTNTHKKVFLFPDYYLVFSTFACKLVCSLFTKCLVPLHVIQDTHFNLTLDALLLSKT